MTPWKIPVQTWKKLLVVLFGIVTILFLVYAAWLLTDSLASRPPSGTRTDPLTAYEAEQSRVSTQVFHLAAAGLAAALVLGVILASWVWVDAWSRQAPRTIWAVLTLVLGTLGWVIYLFLRPRGRLAGCEVCGNVRLETLPQCPFCRTPHQN